MVRGVPVGIAYLQAPGESPSRQPASPARGKTKVVTRSEFFRAGRLLRLLVQYAQTLDVAELRKAELMAARRAVAALEQEQSRLRRALGRILPTNLKSPTADGAENHAEQVAHAALAMVHQQYSQPLTLGQCARALGLNAAYLSALFSRTVGVPFKAYLTELRVQKAKQLLGDSSRQVCEVACTVGYASENRFRIAFRQATGCSPRIWRKTFHTGA